MCSIASSAFATRPLRCVRHSAAPIGTTPPALLAQEWDNRKRLAPGVTTPQIDDLIARASAAGAEPPKCAAPVVAGACSASHRRSACRRFVRPSPRGAPPAALHDRNRRPAQLNRTPARCAMALDNLAVARVLSEIADMLELKGDNPFKIRAYRSGADHRGQYARSRSRD